MSGKRTRGERFQNRENKKKAMMELKEYVHRLNPVDLIEKMKKEGLNTRSKLPMLQERYVRYRARKDLDDTTSRWDPARDEDKTSTSTPSISRAEMMPATEADRTAPLPQIEVEDLTPFQPSSRIVRTPVPTRATLVTARTQAAYTRTTTTTVASTTTQMRMVQSGLPTLSSTQYLQTPAIVPVTTSQRLLMDNLVRTGPTGGQNVNAGSISADRPPSRISATLPEEGAVGGSGLTMPQPLNQPASPMDELAGGLQDVINSTMAHFYERSSLLERRLTPTSISEQQIGPQWPGARPKQRNAAPHVSERPSRPQLTQLGPNRLANHLANTHLQDFELPGGNQQQAAVHRNDRLEERDVYSNDDYYYESDRQNQAERHRAARPSQPPLVDHYLYEDEVYQEPIRQDAGRQQRYVENPPPRPGSVYRSQRPRYEQQNEVEDIYEDSDSDASVYEEHNFQRRPQPNRQTYSRPIGGKAVEALHKWRISYTNERKESAESFLERLERCCRGSGLPSLAILDALPVVLYGEAEKWYRLKTHQLRSMQEFKTLFRERFGDRNARKRIKDEARQRLQEKGENMKEFIENMETIFSYMSPPLPEHKQLDIVYDNLRPVYTKYFLRSSFTSYRQLLEIGYELEQKWTKAKIRNNTKYTGPSLVPSAVYKPSSKPNDHFAAIATEEEDSAAEDKEPPTSSPTAVKKFTKSNNFPKKNNQEQSSNVKKTRPYVVSNSTQKSTGKVTRDRATSPLREGETASGSQETIQKPNKETHPCFNCLKFGHWANECTVPRKFRKYGTRKPVEPKSGNVRIDEC